LVGFPGLSEGGSRRLAETAAALRPFVREVAAEAAGRIEEAGACGPIHSSVLVCMIGHFVDLLEDQERSSEVVLRLARRIGEGEAREGRGLAGWHEAVRSGVTSAIIRLGELAGQAGLTRELGHITQAVFSYADHITEAVVQGHLEAGGRAVHEADRVRHELVELLLSSDPSATAVAAAAGRAHWTIPETVAVAALYPRSETTATRTMLPPEVLVDLRPAQPVAIVPDADGPGRRHQLETGLHDWVAAVGPSVRVTRASDSLRWARQALALGRRNLVDSDKLIVAIDHVPLMLLTREPELVKIVEARRLAPLAELKPHLRDDLARTLLSLIEHRFVATAVAADLLLHPQTVRYRLRRLEDLFGPALYDPRQQLELHLVLRGRLAGATPWTS